MPADRADLRSRIAAATPQDTVRGLVFNGVFSVVREHLGEENTRATDPLAKGSRTGFLSYPVVDLLTIAWNAADELQRVLGGVDAAFYEMGRHIARTVFRSLWGRTLLSLAGGTVGGLLEQVGSGYRGAASYGERSVTWIGPRHCLLTFKRDFFLPPYHCGILATAIEIQGARGVRVNGRGISLLDSEYEATWDR